MEPTTFTMASLLVTVKEVLAALLQMSVSILDVVVGHPLLLLGFIFTFVSAAIATYRTLKS